MANLADMIEPPKLDSVFGARAAARKNNGIMEIRLDETVNFKDHPYQVKDDDAMRDMADSIKEHGVLSPVLVRPRPEGGYEMVSGHRRKRACELAGMETIPAIVRDMDDDTAIIAMVDANLQREDILPSEKAKAFKMKMDALRRQGERRDLTSRHDVGKLETAEKVGQEAGITGRHVQRLIRLGELEPDLLDMVDNKEMAINPAYELSFLNPDEQQILADLVKCEERTPSLSQAQRLKQLSQQGELTEEKMLAVMTEQKPQQRVQVVLKEERLSKYFPKTYTPKQIEDVIIKLLEGWHKKRQQEQER
ncbi:ParB/RepB/Spo0J family partition protein [Ruminococcaceae bacterium OttesenSCG-928-A11]|nr:ParB/RepB/Spo0J family partition protein [Ruminococcaceae bacterium OttesenSCG-928-A11]